MRHSVLPGLVLCLAACGSQPATEASPSAPAPTAAAPTPAERLANLHAQIDASPVVEALAPDLELYRDLRDDVFGRIATTWRTGGDLAAAAPGATGPDFARGTRQLVRTVDGIAEHTWSAGLEAPLAASLAGLGFHRVEAASLDVVSFDRTAAGAEARVRYDVRGFTADGTRRQDRGELVATLTLEGDTPRLAKLTLTEGASLELVGRAPTFADATADAGLSGVDMGTRAEAIRRGGYAVAAGDVDGDGFVDLLLGNYGPMRFYKGGAHGFTDVTAQIGLRGETKVKSAALVDLDNDGHRDIVLARFVEPGDTEQGDFVAYRNVGDGTFERKGDVLTRSRTYDRSMPIAVADFDGNGLLDVYVGFPGARDFTNQLAKDDTPATAASQGIWLNRGDWSFQELAIGPDDVAQGQPRVVYPHAALVSDLNRDGRPDILITDDSGAASPVYFNDGHGKFRDVAVEQGLAHTGWGMGTAVGDFDGDGHPDVYRSGIDLAGPRALAASLDARGNAEAAEALEVLRNGLPPNALFRNKGDGTFEEIGAEAGVDWAGDAPAVAEWVDYNLDGHLDLYVPNGLWSGGPQRFDDLFFTAALADRHDGPTDEALPMGFDRGDTLFRMSIYASAGDPDPNPVLTILRNFKGDLYDPMAAATSEVPSVSFGGYERNRLFRNDGDGTFTEVGFLEAADRVEDGYVATMLDVDHDGRQDLLLRNCDPAPGHPAPAVVLLRNARPDARSLTVLAQGTFSNHDGIGTVVTAHVDGRKLVREIRSVSGAVQHEPVVYFGLGEADHIDRLEVRFPSGNVQVFEDVAPGRVKVREGVPQLTLLAAG